MPFRMVDDAAGTEHAAASMHVRSSMPERLGAVVSLVHPQRLRNGVFAGWFHGRVPRSFSPIRNHKTRRQGAAAVMATRAGIRGVEAGRQGGKAASDGHVSDTRSRRPQVNT